LSEALNVYIDNRPAFTWDHCVLCTRCCLCLWIVHSLLQLRFSYTFISFSIECSYYKTK